MESWRTWKSTRRLLESHGGQRGGWHEDEAVQRQEGEAAQAGRASFDPAPVKVRGGMTRGVAHVLWAGGELGESSSPGEVPLVLVW
ncbi:hypothetical protein ACP70R_002645 [Stipagrostis hirtigluma subsp. patula]